MEIQDIFFTYLWLKAKTVNTMTCKKEHLCFLFTPLTGNLLVAPNLVGILKLWPRKIKIKVNFYTKTFLFRWTVQDFNILSILIGLFKLNFPIFFYLFSVNFITIHLFHISSIHTIRQFFPTFLYFIFQKFLWLCVK